MRLRAGESVSNIVAAAFINSDPSRTNWRNSGGNVRLTNSNVSSEFHAPVDLPHGARITRMAAVMDMQSGGSEATTVQLMQLNDQMVSSRSGDTRVQTDLWTDSTESLIFISGPTNVTGHRILLEDGVEGIVIDNLNFSYYITAHLTNGCALKSVKIFYTLE
jgi:hypothetical protein